MNVDHKHLGQLMNEVYANYNQGKINACEIANVMQDIKLAELLKLEKNENHINLVETDHGLYLRNKLETLLEKALWNQIDTLSKENDNQIKEDTNG